MLTSEIYPRGDDRYEWIIRKNGKVVAVGENDNRGFATIRNAKRALDRFIEVFMDNIIAYGVTKYPKLKLEIEYKGVIR